jgi:hypothetical protein
MDGKKLEAGEKCWLYKHGLLNIVTVTETDLYDLGYRIRYEAGFMKGTIDVSIGEHLYAFPSEKERLLKAINQDIQLLEIFKETVIIERVDF